MCATPWAIVALVASLYWLMRPRPGARWSFGDVAGSWGLGLSAGALVGGGVKTPVVPAVLAFAVPSAAFGAAALCVVRAKYGLPLAQLGLRFDRTPRRIVEGLVGGAAAIAASGAAQLVTVALLTAVLRHAPAAPSSGPSGCGRSIYDLLPHLRGNIAGLALAAAVVGIVAPAGEEILFRGLALGALRQRFTRHIAVGISALVFAAAHLQPAQVLALAALGWVLGYLYDTTGSLVPGMIAHSLHNMVMLVVVQVPR
ncbi:MAG TPA: CPBP family intramembrane glutamic endopeptidase [bacterium]|nr:CPBP family intramembrane glutamic endopeptidase [bacterium]